MSAKESNRQRLRGCHRLRAMAGAARDDQGKRGWKPIRRAEAALKVPTFGWFAGRLTLIDIC
ncbi:MAG: hypothetical protein ACK5CQ_11220, partial [Cyanobacteriota bacterium]